MASSTVHLLTYLHLQEYFESVLVRQTHLYLCSPWREQETAAHLECFLAASDWDLCIEAVSVSVLVSAPVSESVSDLIPMPVS